MRISTLFVSILFSTICTSAAFAEEPQWSRTAIIGVQSGYPLQDFGLDGSPNHWVNHNVFAFTRGHSTFDVFTSTGLSTKGSYGKRGLEDEIDLEYTYANSTKVPVLGQIDYTLYGAWFLLDLGKGLKNPKDDYAQVYGEVAKPIQVGGDWKVSPYGRYTENIALGNQLSFRAYRAGLRLDGPIGPATIHLDGGSTWNRGEDRAYPYRQVWRGEAMVSAPITPEVIGTIGVKATEHIGVTFVTKVAVPF